MYIRANILNNEQQAHTTTTAAIISSTMREHSLPIYNLSIHSFIHSFIYPQLKRGNFLLNTDTKVTIEEGVSAKMTITIK